MEPTVGSKVKVHMVEMDGVREDQYITGTVVEVVDDKMERVLLGIDYGLRLTDVEFHGIDADKEALGKEIIAATGKLKVSFEHANGDEVLS